jgi:hypothetical protein
MGPSLTTMNNKRKVFVMIKGVAMEAHKWQTVAFHADWKAIKKKEAKCNTEMIIPCQDKISSHKIVIRGCYDIPSVIYVVNIETKEERILFTKDDFICHTCGIPICMANGCRDCEGTGNPKIGCFEHCKQFHL